MATRKKHIQPPTGALKWVLLGCGFLALGAGVVGLFLPIVPSLPFLIVAAACFARSSQKFHDKLLANQYFGPTLREWEDNRRLPAKTKYFGIAFLVIGLGTSIVLFVEPLWLQITMAAIGIVIAIGMCFIPVKK